MDGRLKRHLDLLISRYPGLNSIRKDIMEAYLIMEKCFEDGCKLLIAGNGGSAADSEHIAGELMKGFKLPRRVSKEFAEKLRKVDPVRGKRLEDSLECGLAAIPLTANGALATAYLNDVGAEGIFAQQLLGYGRDGDVFLGISTSGNSGNVISAAVTARALGISVVALTGKEGGALAGLADVAIQVPEKETYMVQELHIPVYHCLCLMLEEHFFGD